MTRILWFQPRPWSLPRRGADVRTQGLISAAIDSGHEVLLVSPGVAEPGAPDNGASHLALGRHASPFMWALTKVVSRHPLRAPHAPRPQRRQARRRIEEFQPEIVIVSEVMSWSLAAGLAPPGAPLVYDAHNVERTLYRELSAQSVGLWNRLTAAVDERRVARAEGVILGRASVVMAVSDDDAAVFANRGEHHRVRVVPSSVPTPHSVADPAAVAPATLFVGSLDYEPNVAAVMELVTDLLPAVRRVVPEATLAVVGRGASDRLRRLIQATAGATLHENIDDLAAAYRQTRCVVIPIRSGGGTKLKAFEALAFGVPMVCTSETVRGIDVRPGEAIVADTCDDLVAGVLSLLRDPRRASQIGSAGRRAFDERLSWKVVRRPLEEALNAVATPPTR